MKQAVNKGRDGAPRRSRQHKLGAEMLGVCENANRSGRAWGLNAAQRAFPRKPRAQLGWGGILRSKWEAQSCGSERMDRLGGGGSEELLVETGSMAEEALGLRLGRGEGAEGGRTLAGTRRGGGGTNLIRHRVAGMTWGSGGWTGLGCRGVRGGGPRPF